MRLRARDTDRLQCVSLIKRIGDLAGIRGDPVDWLVGDFGRHEIDGRRDRCWRTLADVSADRPRRWDAGNCWHSCRRGGYDRATWRNVLQDPAEQGRQVRRNTRRWRE